MVPSPFLDKRIDQLDEQLNRFFEESVNEGSLKYSQGSYMTGSSSLYSNIPGSTQQSSASLGQIGLTGSVGQRYVPGTYQSPYLTQNK